MRTLKALNYSAPSPYIQKTLNESAPSQDFVNVLNHSVPSANTQKELNDSAPSDAQSLVAERFNAFGCSIPRGALFIKLNPPLMASEAAAAADEVVLDSAPFFRLYKSGRVERLLGTSVVAPGLDPDTSVLSKDVPLHPDSPIPSARLYLPQTLDDDEASETETKTKPKLPVLVYFHGGGFVVESAASPTYHAYLNALASRARILVVSVEYRRAPEHPLAAVYDDSWAVLRWAAAAGAGADPWIAERGDLARVFLGGDSAGGNIAHNVAVRVAAEGGLGVGIEGLILIHPWFSAEEAIGAEEEIGAERRRKMMKGFWEVVSPGTEVAKDPRMNPMAEGLETMKKLPCERVMVTVAEKDESRKCGRWYCEGLKKSGFEGSVELLESEGQEHVFHLRNPNSDKASEMMDRVVAFLNSPHQN